MRRSPLATLLVSFASCASVVGCTAALAGCGDAVAKAKTAPAGDAKATGPAAPEARLAETPVAIAAATHATVVGALCLWYRALTPDERGHLTVKFGRFIPRQFRGKAA